MNPTEPIDGVETARRKRAWYGLLGRNMQFTLDLSVLTTAFALAYLLRFEFSIPAHSLHHGIIQLVYVVFLQFSILFLSGIYSFIWRYVGMAEIGSFLKAAIWSLAILVALRLGLPSKLQELRIPLSIILMDTIFAFGGVLSLRVMRRALYERYEKLERATNGHGNGEKKAVLLIGAGKAGVHAAREIQGRGDEDLDIKGFIDDDPVKGGAVIQGIRVLGTTEELPELVESLGIDQAIITIARTSRRMITRIVKICESIPVKVRIIPGYYDILDGSVSVSSIRDVEIEDLLGRDPVRLDEEEVGRFLSGERVAVTGAGGSIGSELARQVARLGPAELILVERAEFALFDVHSELVRKWPGLSVVPFVGDVTDEERMRALFNEHQPRIIFHAAAHKHVPMMEFNPTEAVKNNIGGTETLGRIAGEMGARAFIFISTDKAVRPTSMMGASKRVAELVAQCFDQAYSCRYVAVRFGNVLGSAGSVIPIFREQIKRGGPVTVTHPDMVRYFMTIPEASQLVLQAGAMGKGGEIFVLDMGEPVRIIDLAREMITLSGFKPGEDIEIVFTGTRPGEKLFEELATTEENVTKTRHPKIFIGRLAPYPEAKVREALTRLNLLSKGDSSSTLREYLNEILPEARLGAGEEPAGGPLLEGADTK